MTHADATPRHANSVIVLPTTLRTAAESPAPAARPTYTVAPIDRATITHVNIYITCTPLVTAAVEAASR